MKRLVKNIWWNARLWTYRKLHASLIAQYTEPENFHSLLQEHSIATITRQTGDGYMPEDPESTFCGVIANDWLVRINDKIAEKEKKS